MRFSPLRIIGLLLPILCALLPACRSQGGGIPASELDVKINILDFHHANAITIWVQFMRDGNVVGYIEEATVTCNGKALDFVEPTYTVWITEESMVGSDIVFAYTLKGVETTISVPYMPRPDFTFPTAGETVTRSAMFTITYEVSHGNDVSGSASDGSSSVEGNPKLQPDNGMYSGLNVSAFEPGTGSIYLRRELAETLTDTGFNSVKINYMADARIEVTWE